MIDDNIERALRLALDTQARRIDIAPDGLTTIRARTRKRRRGRRGGFMVTLSTGTGVLAVTAVFAFANVTGGCQSKPTAANPPTASSPATATATPSPRPTTGSAITVNVPIYYVGPGVKLYREYHPVSAPSDGTAAQLTAAISQMLGPTALDPDYRSGWPAGVTVRSVTVPAGPGNSLTGSIATVDLHGVSSAAAMSPSAGNAALQQLIWTATAYTGGTGVVIHVDGKPVSEVLGVPAAGVLYRGPAADVLAPLWIIDPQQGAVTGTTVTVHVAGIIFEGQFALRFIRPGSTSTVKVVTAQLSAGAPVQGTATVDVTLAPGTYTVQGINMSMKGTGQSIIDDHTFTVTG